MRFRLASTSSCNRKLSIIVIWICLLRWKQIKVKPESDKQCKWCTIDQGSGIYQKRGKSNLMNWDESTFFIKSTTIIYTLLPAILETVVPFFQVYSEINFFILMARHLLLCLKIIVYTLLKHCLKNVLFKKNYPTLF